MEAPVATGFSSSRESFAPQRSEHCVMASSIVLTFARRYSWRFYRVLLTALAEGCPRALICLDLSITDNTGRLSLVLHNINFAGHVTDGTKTEL